uniref:G-protein alpha subunit n=1 Tax=Heterorhabditis bacteriophora TaxID=37862 RepID=A0A1I7WLE9_HETBA
MVDVGGQRTERRKWIHCFDNVNMILFVVSMSDYDLQDPEDSRQNRMLQNFEIFRTIVQSDFFKNATVVLFLNKYDVFRDKLNSSPLQKCWSHYNGDNSVDDATEFMKKQFRRCIHERHKYFNFVTTATDTNNIELVFSSAIAHIINESLKSTGLHE